MLDRAAARAAPVYLRLERGHRLKRWLARRARVHARRPARDALAQRAARPAASACSCSRCRTGGSSGRARCSRRSAAVALLLAYVLYSRWHYFSVVLRSRVQTGGASSSAHFAVYDFIPQIIHSHPLLGLGLNTFSVYYEFVTGKTNWGPHSFWVALDRRDGARRPAALLVFLRYVVPAPARGAAARPACWTRRRSDGRRVRPLAMGDHRSAHRDDGRELLLPDDVSSITSTRSSRSRWLYLWFTQGGKIRSRVGV